MHGKVKVNAMLGSSELGEAEVKRGIFEGDFLYPF